MKIQGWNSIMLPQVKKGGGTTAPPLPLSGGCSNNVFKETPTPASGGDVRIELLDKIKQKIKAGYYNSDAVIDDIGYGFAQAIDHSL